MSPKGIGNHVSPNLLGTWIKTCEEHYKTCYDLRSSCIFIDLTGPRSLRYVDTVNMCLRSRPWYELSFTQHGAMYGVAVKVFS